jgi:phosphohistidine phosphatase SixA
LKIYVMRHSDAGAFIPNDPKAERERGLTKIGVKLATAVAKKMIATNNIPKVIFASPLERTKQTADLVGSILKIQVNLIDDLAPNRPLEDRLLELIAHKQVRRVMVVCHSDNTGPAFNNFGGDMGDWAIDGDESGDWPVLMKAELRKLRVDRDSGSWDCLWRLLPSDLGFQDDL